MVLACFFADDVVFMLAEIMVCDVFFFFWNTQDISRSRASSCLDP